MDEQAQELPEGPAPPGGGPTWSDYAQVVAALSVWTVALFWLQRRSATAVPREALLPPLFAMLLLVLVVWLLMVVVRNSSVLRGLASAEYYVDYTRRVPDEKIERPARAFNNLMQVPTLFYVGVVVLIALDVVSQRHVEIAWAFVVSRVLHAAVYVIFNDVKWRFCCWMLGGVALLFFWLEIARAAFPA